MSYNPDRSAPVIVQNRDALEALLGFTKASGSVTFVDVPHDGSVITISDGVTSRAYTFVATLTGAANEVLIGTAAATMAAFIAAVNVNTPAVAQDPARGVRAVAGSTTLIAALTNTIAGTLGNVAITNTVHTDHITVAGMTGGADGIGLDGGIAAATPNAVAVGATTTVILAADVNRQLAIVTNVSDALVYVAVGAAAVSGKGVPLSALSGQSAGGSLVLTGALARLAINGISSGAGKNVATQVGTIS